MNLCLSNLVDLALGSPSNLNCDNFDILHTLLHVILKKLDIAGTCVELSNRSAENAEMLMKNLPQEPAICFKEYHLKPDGGKIRKKSKLAIGARKSLIHVNKKWPKCCTQIEISSKNDIIISKFEERLSLIESEISRISSDSQALKAFKNDDLNLRKNSQKSHNDCELKVNIRNEIEELDSDEDSSEDMEISWLKRKLLELTDSLKLHSNCLKKLKCEELPKIYSLQKNLADTFHEKCSVVESVEGRESTYAKKVIENHMAAMQNEISNINKNIQKLEFNFETYCKKVDSELCTLRVMFINKNIEKSPDEDKFKTCDKNKQIDSKEKLLNEKQKSTLESHQKNFHTFSSSLNEIQKQLTSHSVCMHQFVRDLSSKIDRPEFEIFSRELNDIIDVVMQLKRDIGNSPSLAAGCSIPLMKNLNCISCQASTNMTITTTAIPKFPSLNFGHCRVDSEHCHDNVDDMKVFSRKAGGSHTKLSRRLNVSRMKCKRLNTPYRCTTPLFMYKNRYRKNFNC